MIPLIKQHPKTIVTGQTVKPVVGKVPIAAQVKPVVGKAPIAVPVKPLAGKAPIAVPVKPLAGKAPIAAQFKPKAPIAVPVKPLAGKAPIAVPVKPTTAKLSLLKGIAGEGFHDFKNGIMINDGKGNLDDRNDWLESISVKSGHHIAACYLITPYKEWIYNFQHDCTMNPDFMSWLFDEFVPREEARERLYPFELVESGFTRRQMLDGIKNKRVKYLNKDQREQKKITVNNKGLLIDYRNQVYHTGTEVTLNSGPGWAIFVMDKNNTIYAGSHIPGEYHHSSFLGGNYVSSAGEIAVCNGRLVGITCKSGHYRPSLKNMIYFLNSLNDRHVNLKNIPIQLEWSNQSPPKFYDAHEALKTNGRCVKQLPAPARVF